MDGTGGTHSPRPHTTRPGPGASFTTIAPTQPLVHEFGRGCYHPLVASLVRPAPAAWKRGPPRSWLSVTSSSWHPSVRALDPLSSPIPVDTCRKAKQPASVPARRAKNKLLHHASCSYRSPAGGGLPGTEALPALCAVPGEGAWMYGLTNEFSNTYEIYQLNPLLEQQESVYTTNFRLGQRPGL